MKSILLYAITLLILNQTQAQALPGLVKAFKSNNTSYIINQLDNNVEITHDGRNASYNKSQAGKFLTDFFAANKANDFKVLHQSESGGTAYCIGNLSTSSGTYRVTIFTKDKGGNSLIQEIKIEK